MKADQQDILDYILGELPADRREPVAELIRTDDNWKREFEKWSAVMGQLNNEKTGLQKLNEAPDRYWNSFLPRVHERIDDRAQRRRLLRGRLIHAVPSFGLAVLILFFLNNVLITNKKIDYLLDQYSWISSLNTTEVIDQYVSENVSAADEFVNSLIQTGEDNTAVLTEWDGTYSPTETALDDNNLTQDEQKELYENLEKTTSF